MAEKSPDQIKKEHEEAARKREQEQKNQEEQRKKQQGEQHNQQHPNQQPPHPSGQHQAQRSAGGSSGKISTYSATKSDVIPGADPRGEERVLSHDEVESVKGDMLPGQLAFVKLNEEGTPEGAAITDIPDQGDVVAPVFASPKAVFEDVVTPSGAPLTKYMNPQPKLWDDGMMARNPVPKEDRNKGREYNVPAGGGVVNTPVRV